MNLPQALAEIRRLRALIDALEDTIADQELQIDDLEHTNCQLEQQIADSWVPVSEEELNEIEERVFLRDIGFDPDRLPISVGERMAIRDAISQTV